MGVAAAEASAEPEPPSMGMATTKAKTVSAAGEIHSPSVQLSIVAAEAGTRATNVRRKQKGRQSLYVVRGCENQETRKR